MPTLLDELTLMKIKVEKAKKTLAEKIAPLVQEFVLVHELMPTSIYINYIDITARGDTKRKYLVNIPNVSLNMDVSG